MSAEPRETAIIDLQSAIGIYPLCNAGAILVHRIDYGEDRILASMPGEPPEWCEMKEESVDGELELGFSLGSFFVPFADVIRFYGGSE